MKNNEIYKYLNEIKTDFEELEISEIEMEKLKKFARKNSKKKRFFGRKFAGLAAAVLLAFGVVIGTNENVRAEVISYVEKFFTEVRVPLNEAKKIPEEVQKYTVNLHETVQLKHISFVVEDVMIDGKNGYLNLIYPEEYSTKNNDFIYIIDKIYVNGEPKTALSSGSIPTKLENGLISDMRDFTLNEPFPENGNINLVIVFTSFYDSNDTGSVEVNLSMEEINKDSRYYLKDFNIPEANGYKVDMMKINLVNPRIEMSEPNREGNDIFSSTKFIGKTEDSKTILFTMAEGMTVEKEYKSVYEFKAKNENSDEITSDLSLKELNELEGKVEFQMYKTKYDREPSGKMIKKDTIKIGEPFIVEFNK